TSLPDLHRQGRALPRFFFFKQKTAYEIFTWTGVQTCALPIFRGERDRALAAYSRVGESSRFWAQATYLAGVLEVERKNYKRGERSEERRVGKECRSRWPAYH